MKRNRRGVTIVEALVVVLVGTIIVMTVLGLLNFSTKSFGRTAQRGDPREQASHILMTLRRYLLDAKRYRVQEKGSRLMFMAPRSIGAVNYDAATGSLAVRNMLEPGGKPEVLGTGIRGFSIHQLRKGVLRVSLEIERPIVQDGLASLGPLKIVDEICCASAQRNRMIPWHRTFEGRPKGLRGARGKRRGGDDNEQGFRRRGKRDRGEQRDNENGPQPVVAD